jgi:plastocyanin
MEHVVQKLTIVALISFLTAFGKYQEIVRANELPGENIEESKLIEMAPYLGYLKVHNDLQKPLGLLGGAIKVIVEQNEGGVHVALPDYRRLDPRVFGIPELPRAYGGTPVMSGIPPKMREVENGQYTRLNTKTPFGHDNIVLDDGRFRLEAIDSTATDAAVTEDSVNMEASWKDRDGNTYTVKCNKVAPHGVEYPTFGGVLTNHILHGSSRIGTPLMPTEYVYVAFWGTGETQKNGQTLDSDLIVHCMLTELVRTTDYELALDDQVTPTRLQMHLIVPPIVVKDGKFTDHPVKTGFTLDNGRELPFWHVMFANLDIHSERLARQSDITSQDAADVKQEFTVYMTDSLTFYPEVIEIKPGDTVVWKNMSFFINSVTDNAERVINKNDVSLPDGAKPFDSGVIQPGQSYRHTFEKPGTYRYVSRIHEPENMRGIVIVK